MSVAWVMADSRRLVLAYHTPQEWAEIVRRQLVSLGCSPEYADRRARTILTARLT